MKLLKQSLVTNKSTTTEKDLEKLQEPSQSCRGIWVRLVNRFVFLAMLLHLQKGKNYSVAV